MGLSRFQTQGIYTPYGIVIIANGLYTFGLISAAFISKKKIVLIIVLCPLKRCNIHGESSDLSTQKCSARPSEQLWSLTFELLYDEDHHYDDFAVYKEST